MNEVERLAEMERQRRQREVEARMVEEESAARIEALVQQRVQEELERRKVRIVLRLCFANIVNYASKLIQLKLYLK